LSLTEYISEASLKYIELGYRYNTRFSRWNGVLEVDEQREL